ncbi:hypothetical protein PD653_4215 [Nocardioides sp. PD653]|nr:hypothetical protein PD653B2_4581 [Nocardioides sp. PD653-B2]GAW56777.1 hypothetical protein PD653_4215 [Nocardioides sp. PD653]
MLVSTAACALLLLAGCGDQRAQPTASTPAPARHTIPAGFPLLKGYPPDSDAESAQDGREGPSRSMEPMVPEACGSRAQVPTHDDWLRGSWTNPEDYRQRQLVDFAHLRQARAYAERLLDLYRDCPREGPRDDTGHHAVQRGHLGDAAGIVTTTYTYRGSPRPGLMVTHVVRVGTAVLLALTYNEGGAGRHPAREAARERRRTAHEIEGVVTATRHQLK